MKVEELFEKQLTEGPLDYIRGASRYAGQKIYNKMAEKGRQIAEPFRQAHAAGKVASAQGDIKSLSRARKQLIQQLVTLAEKAGPDAVIAVLKSTFAQREIALYNRLKKDFIEAAQAARPHQPTNEGLWDYLRGAGGAAGGAAKRAGASIGGAAKQAGQAIGAAGRAVGSAAKQSGQAVGQAVSDIHASGQQKSLQAEIVKTVEMLGSVTKRLIALRKQYPQQPIRQEPHF